MKIKGAELKAWMDDAWPGADWYWDHDLFDDEPDLLANYDTDDLGDLRYQGRPGGDPTCGEGYDLPKLIRAWRKTHGKTIMVVAVPPENAGAFKAALKAAGGTTL